MCQPRPAPMMGLPARTRGGGPDAGDARLRDGSPREGMTMRSAIRNVAATASVLAATVLVFASMAAPAAQARVIDCVVQPQPAQGACYEPVWVNGQQIIMTFPQAGVPVHRVPSRSEEHTSELQSLAYLLFRLLLG